VRQRRQRLVVRTLLLLLDLQVVDELLSLSLRRRYVHGERAIHVYELRPSVSRWIEMAATGDGC